MQAGLPDAGGPARCRRACPMQAGLPDAGGRGGKEEVGLVNNKSDKNIFSVYHTRK